MGNPAKTLETLPQFPQFTAESGKTAVKMEKFRDFMMKFYQTTQNNTLSEAQNSIFEKRLDQILPLLNNTPDHPPYAWMIQKAIEELAEKGESSEKLISDYIKKEHKDLPWAHDTLLNHHLKNLCASGEIVLTNNQTYVFPVSHSDVEPCKKTTKNKHVRKERDWDLLRKKKKKKKKSKQQKAVRKQYTVKKEDKDEKRPSFDPEGQDVLKQVPEGQVVLYEVPEGQDVLNEVRDMQIVEICGPDAQSNPKQLNAEAELSCDDELKQVQCRLPLKVTDNDTKSQQGTSPSLDGAAETLDEYMQALEPITNMAKFGLQQIECGEHRAIVTQTKPTEVLYQQTIPDLKPTTDEKTCVPQSVNSSGADKVRHIVCKYEYRTPGKKLKENQTKKQELDKCDPLLEQSQKQLDARDSVPIINANEVRLLSGSAKGLLHSEGTTGMQRRLRNGKVLSQEEGTGRMERNLQSCENKSAEHLKPHVVEMHDDKDSNESSDVETPLKSVYRGRGRPRKFKPESCGSGKLTTSTKKTAEEEEVVQQHLEMESEKPKPSKKKKGRGRPPKLKKRVKIQNNPEIRRGRGRPRKNIIQ